MIKAVFFDIDGTLLCHRTNSVCPSTRYAISELRKKGILTFIATGRHASTVENLDALQGIEFDGYVTLNGQYCYKGKEVIYDCAVDPEDIAVMLDYVRRHPLALGFMEDRKMYVNLHNDDVRIVHEFIHSPLPEIGDLEAGSKNKIYQMILYANEEEIDKLPPLAHTRITRWMRGGVDMIPADGGKAIGIKNVLAYFGLTKEEAAAFGDGENDIDMFEMVGTAIAMGNANEQVKAHADYVTESVDEDGIYHALVRLGVIPAMEIR